MGRGRETVWGLHGGVAVGFGGVCLGLFGGRLFGVFCMLLLRFVLGGVAGAFGIAFWKVSFWVGFLFGEPGRRKRGRFLHGSLFERFSRDFLCSFLQGGL